MMNHLMKIQEFLKTHKVRSVNTDAFDQLVITASNGDQLAITRTDEWLVVKPMHLEDLS
ncbi:hypothetical protein D3C75_158600 [compost metagenome]